MPVTPAATFCATLVDEWVGAGLRTAMVAPGSRSTPMVLALAAHPDVEVHVFHDERSAAFAALGYGLVEGRPAAVLCSSGTAGTHFHGAVVEADLSSVPMLVLTADRPPELRDVGAAQTIDQTHLFGRAVRWFHDPGVPTEDTARSWRSLARRAYRAAVDGRAGPVHLNLPFREPLVAEAGPLPPGEAGPLVVTAPAAIDGLDAVATRLERQRGVIVAGRGAGATPETVAALGELADATGWPVLADPRSACRGLPSAVSAADALLRHGEFARAHTPEVVVHIGEPWASRVVNEWLAGSGAYHVHLSAVPRPLDPGLVVGQWVTAPVAASCRWLAGRLTGARGTTWPARWQHAERTAQTALASVLDGRPGLCEPQVARLVVDTLAAAGPARLVVASSMPIRDVEWYTRPVPPLEVLANRGANGIDGTIATAIGAAMAHRSLPTGVLVGDVAFLHDATSLTALARRGLDLRVVVVDNDGGGIFSFLPQARGVAPALFETLWGTPHGTDLVALAAAHGLDALEATTEAELVDALRRCGPRVTVVRSNRASNMDVHDAAHRAVLEALG